MSKKIEKIINEYLLSRFFVGNEDTLNSETKLLTSGIIDSIAALQLVEFLEKEFNFEFEANEVDRNNLDTPTLIAEFVKTKVAS